MSLKMLCKDMHGRPLNHQSYRNDYYLTQNNYPGPFSLPISKIGGFESVTKEGRCDLKFTWGLHRAL